MPATPFHVPPAAVAAWPLRRRLDLPTVLLASVLIDIEPLVAMALGIEPPHGPAHTLLGASVVGAGVGWLAWRGSRLLTRLTRWEYPLSLGVAVPSSVAGCWLHVLLDAVMYGYLRPFFPLAANPLHIPESEAALHVLGATLLVPALVLVVRARAWRTVPQRVTLAILALSAVAIGLYALLG